MMYLFGTLKGDYDRMLMPNGNLTGLYGKGLSTRSFYANELFMLSDVNPMGNEDINKTIYNNKTICKQTLEQTDIDNIIRTVRGEI